VLDDIARYLSDDGARTVLIDGRSGSGKTTLAQDLHRAWPQSIVVRLDDIYPGWDGLAWAVDHVGTELLGPLAAGRPGRWRRWNWTTEGPDGWQVVEPGQRLIVEGVGALTPANRASADLGIWVQTPDDERRRRALARDGEMYRPHWERWAAQEVEYLARYQPRAQADWIVTEDGDERVWIARSEL
jgi:uridine kinase